VESNANRKGVVTGLNSCRTTHQHSHIAHHFMQKMLSAR
jgi:hypothetical protein